MTSVRKVIVLDFGPPSMLVSTLFAIIGKLKAKGFGYFLPELSFFKVRQCTHSLQILMFGVEGFGFRDSSTTGLKSCPNSPRPNIWMLVLRPRNPCCAIRGHVDSPKPQTLNRKLEALHRKPQTQSRKG